MPTQPNILLFFTDQQRADTIGALGNPVIRTPHLDRLCAEGTAFTSAYTPSPVCIAARCALHYGQYPTRTGCYENSPMPTDGRPSFMDSLTAEGYRTHGIGKCHFSPDRDGLRGFQTRESQEELVPDPEGDDYLRAVRAAGYAHLCDPHGVRGEMYYVPQPAQMPAALHPTAWVGDRAVAFVTGARAPWFLFCSFIDPHPPFAPPAPWHKLYRAPRMPLPFLPPDADALHTHINRVQNRYKYRDQGMDRNLARNIIAYYYATISFVDAQVGRVLAALEATGALEDTLILFTSDHGELLGDYGCYGKRSYHDAAARVPLLARWPGRLPAGARCDAPASLVDIAPTVLEAAGAAPPPHPLDGVALTALAAGDPRPMVFVQHDRAGRATYTAVSRAWKFAYSAADGREFLFDRRRDPRETRNLVGTPGCGAPRDTMRAALHAHLRALGETAALDGDGWRAYPPRSLPPDPDAGLLVQDHPWADQTIPGYTDEADM